MAWYLEINGNHLELSWALGIILDTMGIILGTLGLMGIVLNTLVQALGNYLEIVLGVWESMESMGIILSTNHFRYLEINENDSSTYFFLIKGI